MSARPPDEPDLPEGLAELFEQLGGQQLIEQVWRSMATAGTGPVNWELARQVAVQVAADGDRPPTEEELATARRAQELAEHWLDEGSLPAPAEAGGLEVVSRQGWVNAAIAGLRPWVEPVAAASTRALTDLITEQLEDVDLSELRDVPELEGVDLTGLLAGIGGPSSVGRVLTSAAGVLMGLQAGQVIGQLSRQLLGQFDLGIPTAGATTAFRLAVNVTDAFSGYGLDDTETAVVLALHEAAHRRQFLAVGWLAGHLRDLIGAFAAGTTIDPEHLMEVAREVMEGVDPDDPEALRDAMNRAADFRLEPTPAQRRVLERIQGVVCLLQAWARFEVARAAADRLPNLGAVEEVLRRRRATQGDGERLLADLLGLDLKPDDETIGDGFVATVHDARGPEGLRRALAHPENLPDTDELAEPSRWLARMAGGEEIPDDASALFGDDHDAPREPPGDERGRADG